MSDRIPLISKQEIKEILKKEELVNTLTGLLADQDKIRLCKELLKRMEED